MGRLSLAVLGPPEVRLDGAPAAFRTRKALALLIYLAVEGRTGQREALASLFWPEADAAHGRAMLRTTLAHLRQALGAAAETFLRLDDESLQFIPGPEAAVDLGTLQAALQPGGDEAGRLARLEAAAGALRGEFLDGFSLKDAPGFDDWAGRQREAWHDRAGAVLDQLSGLQLERGDPRAALATAERWAGADPLNETALRRVMQLRFTSGDRAGALRAYEAGRAALARDLKVEPEPETIALAERLRRGGTPTPPGARSAAAAPAASPLAISSRLVGRAVELADLIAAAHGARRGDTRAVVLTGEAGMGKTRLANEFCAWAEAEGCEVWRGRAFETGGQLPYGPVVEALRGRVEKENAPDDLLGDVWLAELARLLPELRDRYPDLQPAAEGGEVQTRLFESVTRLGAALAARAPAMLFVDDLQWADTASLDLLHYAARRWADERVPVLLVLALRSESAAGLAGWLAGLERALPVRRLGLEPLTLDHTRQWLSGLAGEAGAALGPFSQWLFAETDGQPFFIVELLRSLAESGALAGGWALDPAALQKSFSLPAGTRDVIRQRLLRLNPAAADLLAAGAVLGQAAGFETFRQVAGAGENEALRALDELLAARLLVEAAAPGGYYLFSHDKIREVVYADAGEARRRVFHRRALAALEAEGQAAAILARHALAAGLDERGLTLSLAAGEEALAVFAVHDAIGHFERARGLALELSQNFSRPVDARRLQKLYTLLGRAREFDSDLAAARLVYEEMLSAARALRQPAMEWSALSRLATLAAQWPVDLERANAMLRAARDVAERSGDQAGLAETEWNLAQLSIYQLAPQAALDHSRRAHALALTLDRPDLIARSLNVLAFSEVGLGPTEAVIEHGRAAQAAFHVIGDRAMEIDSAMLAADACLRDGRYAEGLARSRDCLEISQAIGNTWGRANIRMHMAVGLAETGRFGEALRAVEDGIAAAGNIAYLPALLRTVLGNVQRAMFNLTGARAVHSALLADAEGLGAIPAFRAMLAAELCADCVAGGDWDSAVHLARQAAAHRSYTVLPTGHRLWPEVAALTRAGDLDLAESVIDAYAHTLGGYRRHQVLLLRARSLLAGARGDAPAAAGLLAQAAALAETIGLPDDLWQIYAAQGRWREAAAIVTELAAGIDDPALRSGFLAAPPVLALLSKEGQP